MKQKFLALLFFLFFISFSFCQDRAENPFLDAFMKNFDRSTSIDTKIELLQDAAALDQVGMGPVYIMALDYIIENQDIMITEALAPELAALAVRLINVIKYSEANRKMWRLFEESKDTGTRIEILNTLGNTAADDPFIPDMIAVWLDVQNSLFQDTQRTDIAVTAEAVVTLGRIGTEKAFPVLFAAAIIGYPKEVSDKAGEALVKIKGEFTSLIINLINKSSVGEKLQALDLAVRTDSVSDEDLGEIAKSAISYGISNEMADYDDKIKLITLRARAAVILEKLKWSSATKLVIQHFDLAVSDHEKGYADKSLLLGAISCLGAMGTHEAAVRLTLFIEVLNYNIESGRIVDEQTILAVINNLGKLGDKVALDSLLYVKYLDYSSAVKKTAREAQKNLKIR